MESESGQEGEEKDSAWIYEDRCEDVTRPFKGANSRFQDREGIEALGWFAATESSQARSYDRASSIR